MRRHSPVIHCSRMFSFWKNTQAGRGRCRARGRRATARMTSRASRRRRDHRAAALRQRRLRPRPPRAGASAWAATRSRGLGAVPAQSDASTTTCSRSSRPRCSRADVGVAATGALVDGPAPAHAGARVRRRGRAAARAARRAGRGCCAPVARPLDIDAAPRPFVLMVVGVNGVGKTTTIGKLAQRLQREGASVMLAAGDTFRAAAVEQLQDLGRAQRRAGDRAGRGRRLGFGDLRRAAVGAGARRRRADRRHRRAPAHPDAA